jgi:hypothetical protein
VTFTIHDPRPLYDAVVTRIAGQTSKPCGEAVRPPDAEPPYAVVYPLPDRDNVGTLTDPHLISWQLFQVTCVGDTMDEAQWMQRAVRAGLLGWTPTVAGWSPNRVELDLGSGVVRDDDGVVFYTTDRFSIYMEAA